MNMDFDGRPFVAGSIIGVRSFAVDSLGRLTGVAIRDVFKPGENVAKCSPWTFLHRYTWVEEEQQKKGHIIASRGCSCGFWAYFDRGHNPHHSRGNVQALIEGYGTVTTGTRGFRAEKARLVALIEPSGVRFARIRGMVYRLGHSNLDMVWFFLWVGVAVACLTLSFALQGWYWLLLLGILAGGLLAALAPIGFDMEKPTDARCFELVKRNYPDIPVYRSLSAALKDFPLVAPSLPEPASDPDFWERAA